MDYELLYKNALEDMRKASASARDIRKALTGPDPLTPQQAALRIEREVNYVLD